MGITETQRRFKKEMNSIVREKGENESPYDNYLFRGRFQPIRNSRKSIWGVIILVLIITGAWMKENNNGQNIHLGATIGNPVIAQPGERVLSSEDAYYINILSDNQKQVEDIITKLQMSQEKNDINSYRQALTDGIRACTITEANSALDMPPKFKRLATLSNEYIMDIKQALLNWNDYSYSNRESTKKKGNDLMKIAQSKKRQYLVEFEAYLKDNGYKYQKEKDGIIYWYRN